MVSQLHHDTRSNLTVKCHIIYSGSLGYSCLLTNRDKTKGNLDGDSVAVGVAQL